MIYGQLKYPASCFPASSGIDGICILRAGTIIFCGATKNVPIAGSIQNSIIRMKPCFPKPLYK
jgi:hypothetical protein